MEESGEVAKEVAKWWEQLSRLRERGGFTVRPAIMYDLEIMALKTNRKLSWRWHT